MKLKTYICTSMDEAISTIRAELGPDAIIISSLNEGDKVRVTAACENLPVEIKQEAPKTYSSSETKNLLCNILSFHGVPSQISEAIIAAAFALPAASLEKGVEQILADLLVFSPISFNQANKTANQIMLAGPVGAGKTVTLAKLAAEYLLTNRAVEIISADFVKAGAAEQIKAYAAALKVPLSFVKTPLELEKRLANNDKNITYLIDTPGTNPLHSGEISQLTDFILAARQAPMLVLSAGGDPLEMIDLATSFKDLGATRMIMTRFDATKRFGGLLAMLFKEKLEFAGISCGPEIGSRLKESSPSNLLMALKAYLPKNSDIAYTNIGVQKPQMVKTVEKSKPELPVWVTGYKEGKK